MIGLPTSARKSLLLLRQRTSAKFKGICLLRRTIAGAELVGFTRQHSQGNPPGGSASIIVSEKMARLASRLTQQANAQ